MRPNYRMRPPFWWFFSLSVFLFCFWDNAHGSTNVISMQFPMPSDHANGSKLTSRLRWEGMQYLKALPETAELNRSQFLSADLQMNYSTDSLTSKFEMSAGSFLEFNESTLTISEFFIGTGEASRPFSLSFGRKRSNWSALDERWELGVYQPIYNFDVLRPSVQGLTGLFLDWQWQGLRLGARLSPLFIPNQGAPIHSEDGVLRAPSRFFKAPASSTVLIGQPTEIQYNLDIPEIGQLIGHPGYSLMIGFGDTNGLGLWGQGSYSYKPNPYLPVNFLGYLSLPDGQSERPEGDVTLSPYVSYHNLYAADLGWNTKRVNFGLSLLVEVPGEGRFNEKWTRQHLEGFQAMSFDLSAPLWNIGGEDAKLSLGYLHIEGGQSTIAGPNHTGADSTLFDDRLAFQRAMRIQFKGPLFRAFNRTLSASSRWLYDTEQSGVLLITELQYAYSSSMSLLLGGDIIGIPDGDADDDSPNFLNQYRANDRFYGGVTYVF